MAGTATEGAWWKTGVVILPEKLLFKLPSICY